jgi:hypothetical protein
MPNVINIFAGAESELRYDPETLAMRPAAEVADGPVFTIKSLDYFEYQAAIMSADAMDRLRSLVSASLVSIEGDVSAAAKFLAKPNIKIMAALIDAVTEASSGN